MCGYTLTEKTLFIIIIIFLGVIFTVKIIYEEENIAAHIDLLS